MRVSFLVLISVLVPLSIYCQPPYSNFQVLPLRPEPGRAVIFGYTPSPTYESFNVSALVFLNATRSVMARAIEVPLEEDGERLVGTILPSHNDISFLVVFIDSLGNTLDNNDGAGYWSPMYTNEGDVIPGSLASIASMFYGLVESTVYRIDANRDLARKLYERDFNKNPDVKSFYHRQYISSIRYAKDPVLWMNEVDSYSERQDLSEWELRDLRGKFFSIDDTARAKKFETLIQEKYPLGELSFQKKSLEYQIRCSRSKDLDQIAVIEEYAQKASDWPMDEGTMRYFEATMAVFFLKNIDVFIVHNRYQGWHKLADLLSPRGKYLAFYMAAEKLNSKQFIKQAEELIKEATEWKERNLNAPRWETEWSFFSDREIAEARQKELSDWLLVYGNILTLQEKSEEAREIFEKAKHYARTETIRAQRNADPMLILEPSPFITFLNTQNKVTSLDVYKGKIIVLDFWASWCGPCISGFAKMRELEKQFTNENVVFLFINTHEKTYETNRNQAMDIIKEEGYGFTVLFDPDNQSSSKFDFPSLPTVVVIDERGMIRYRYSGLDSRDTLQKVLIKLTGK